MSGGNWRDLSAETLDWVESLHGVVDGLTGPLVHRHRDRLACRRGCASCCTDGISVFEIEAAVIARHYPALLDAGEAAQEGGCAFLDEGGACRVYEHRPY